MTIPTVTSPQSPRFSSPSNTFSPFTNSDVSASPIESLPVVPTGPQRHILHRSSTCRHYVNGELEVARSLGDFGFKLSHIWERKWRYPSEYREKLGVDGFKANVVDNVPFVQQEKMVVLIGRSDELGKDNRYIVIATDGLWEVINPKACMKIIMKLASKYSLDVICRVLLWIAVKRKSTDNISIILVDLMYCNAHSMILRN